VNKLTAAILTVIILYAYNSRAALPDIITDPNTRDTVEYLDAKINSLRSATQAISKVVESSTYTYTTGATISFTHGLTSYPKQFGLYALVVTDVCGFVVGDRIAMTSTDGDGARRGAVWASATTVKFKATTDLLVECADGSGPLYTNNAALKLYFVAMN